MELFVENKNSGLKLPVFVEDSPMASQNCNMFKIVLFEQGSAILSMDEKQVILSAPALLCLNEKESFQVCKSKDLSLRVVYFNPGIVNMALDVQNVYENASTLPEIAKLDHFYFIPFVNRSNACPGTDPGVTLAGIDIGPGTEKKLSLVFNNLQQQLNHHTDDYWPCRSRSFLIEILFLIQYCYSKRDTSQVGLLEVSADMSEILLYLHTHYHQKITIEDLLHEFHTNRNTLNKQFKKETGLSVFEYIIRLRINIACALLRDTSLPVSDIMARVGFTDISNWGRTFKNSVGSTPTEYRKSQQADFFKQQV